MFRYPNPVFHDHRIPPAVEPLPQGILVPAADDKDIRVFLSVERIEEPEEFFVRACFPGIVFKAGEGAVIVQEKDAVGSLSVLRHQGIGEVHRQALGDIGGFRLFVF